MEDVKPRATATLIERVEELEKRMAGMIEEREAQEKQMHETLSQFVRRLECLAQTQYQLRLEVGLGGVEREDLGEREEDGIKRLLEARQVASRR